MKKNSQRIGSPFSFGRVQLIGTAAVAIASLVPMLVPGVVTLPTTMLLTVVFVVCVLRIWWFFRQTQMMMRVLVVFTIVTVGTLFYLSSQSLVLKTGYARYSHHRSPGLVVKQLIDSVFNAVDGVRIAIESGLTTVDIRKESKIQTIRLRVEPNSLQLMASDLPRSAKAKYYRATMWYPEKGWLPIKYRFRGGNIWHHLPEKPSLRLKLKKSHPVDLQRHINLINPEDRPMVTNLLGEEVARRLGVLTHVSSFVRLFINERYFGVYHRTTREDEGMLRFNRRVPGPIYVGNQLSKNWKPEFFEVRGEVDMLGNISPIADLVSAIDMPLGPERYSALWNTISFEKLCGWHASMQIVGGFHTDYNHNHEYYFDPRLGLLEPITSDINGHGMLTFPKGLDRHIGPRRSDHFELSKKARLKSMFRRALFLPPKPRTSDIALPINEALQPLLDVALRDPRFQHCRNLAIVSGLDDQGSTEEQYRILDNYFDLIDRDVWADRHKGNLEELAIGWFRWPFTNREYEDSKAELRRWIKDRNKFLRAQLEDVNVRVSFTQRGSYGLYALVEVDGNSATVLNFAGSGNEIHADTEMDGSFATRLSSSVILYPGLKENDVVEYRHTSRRFPEHYLTGAPQAYLFYLQGMTLREASQLFKKNLRSALSNRILKVEFSEVESLNLEAIPYNKNGMHIWQFPETGEGSIVFGEGRHEIYKDLVVPKNQKLVVRSGAALRLGPGVSIISRGQLVIQGTAEKPVTIDRLAQHKPWGGILVIGEAAKNSSITHAIIRGGSIPEANNVIASGMISVYNVPNFLIESSRVGSNLMSDDVLHIVYGDARILRSSFFECFSDCIDVDYATGDLQQLDIEGSGNDGIDFMESNFQMSDVLVKGATDKGVSIGEASHVNADMLHIMESQTGIAVKDGSKLTIKNSLINKTKIGIDVFRKNWRYDDAGDVYLEKTGFSSNGIDIRVQKEGEVWLGNDSNPERIVGNTNPRPKG
jgi:hypothetical protein